MGRRGAAGGGRVQRDEEVLQGGGGEVESFEVKLPIGACF